MARNHSTDDERARLVLAQEAARIMVEHGVRDYGAAKSKAAERLGMHSRGTLPRNSEIEAAITEHLKLFGGDVHLDLLSEMRLAAIRAMQLLDAFSPRLVGPVLQGTADDSSAVNLHVFSDSLEAVTDLLRDNGLRYGNYERRLRSRRGRNATPDLIPGLQFDFADVVVEATVFPWDGIRQAPISPIDGKPMQRAALGTVAALLNEPPATDELPTF